MKGGGNSSMTIYHLNTSHYWSKYKKEGQGISIFNKVSTFDESELN